MEPELEQALRTAREWAADEEDRGRVARMARVFLAQHARLGEVEAERASLVESYDHLLTTIRDLNTRLADAERRGAREALTRLSNEARLVDLRPHIAQHIAAFRDREYPAPSPVGGERKLSLGMPFTRCKACDSMRDWEGRCDDCEGPRPATPQAAPEPRTCDYVDLMVEESSSGPFVRVKARHIAALLALAARPTGEG